MSSLLTNTSAMVALQTLKTINKNTADVQNQISTGKRISNAKDNAAIWGISTTMQTDVSGFKAISESLSLGTATLTVARDAAETVTSLLDTLKGKIVAAQEENVDRNKIQADVAALKEQISVVVAAAQFNGLNLLDNSDEVSILASLNRSPDGAVTDSQITFRGRDLSQRAGSMGSTASTGIAKSAGTLSATATTGTTATDDVVLSAGQSITVTITPSGGNAVSLTYENTTGGDVTRTAYLAQLAALADNYGFEGLNATSDADSLDFQSTNAFTTFTATITTSDTDITPTAAATIDRRAETITLTAGTPEEGKGYQITFAGKAAFYVAKAGDTMNDVALGLKAAIDNMMNSNLKVQVNLASDAAVTNPTLYIDNSGADIAIVESATTGGTSTGGLFALQGIDVTTSARADNALDNIEPMIQAAINAAASFGSVQGRIQTQSEFVGKIMDGLTSGIGALVDADMEAASARLQALQVQQQLGIQALSIANQQPQNILALFRQ